MSHPHPPAFLILALSAALLPDLVAQPPQAPALDTASAMATLSVRQRNPVKSSSPVVKRTYERRPDKGLEVETGAAAAPSPTAAPTEALVDVEVLHRQDGTQEERRYVALPILFVVGSDQLLDDSSRRNVEEMAAILTELRSKDAKAAFEIQGHTSAEGGVADNQVLSERRAARIRSLLLAKGVDAPALATIGLGEDIARFPENAPESQRQQDRRVLIVRTR